MATEHDLAYEQSRVDEAYKLADEKVAWLRERLDGRPIEAGDNKAADIVKRQWKSKLARLDHLLRPDGEFLLFGRVDFSHDPSLDEELKGATYYVGVERVSDPEDDPTVIAWESRLGRAFTDPSRYGNGHAVDRKRQFTGENRQLLDINDTVFKNGRPEPGQGDPLLAALKGKTTGHMHQVVATIQAEQFRLMEFDADKTLVVQGGPGTGKSIVGLHRVSVLIYRSEGQLAEGDILVVGPSDVFVRYIEKVLPSLGRTAVEHRAITGVGAHGVLAQRRDSGRAREVKGGVVMAEVLARFLEQRITTDMDELEIKPGVYLRGKELQAVLAETRRKLPYMVRRDNVRESMIRQLGTRINGRDDVKNALNRIIPDRSESQAVHDVLSGRKYLAEAAEGLLTLEEQAAIAKPSGNQNDAVWFIDDLPLVDEAAYLLRGSSAIDQYQHILVDEAQDLSPMQLRVLSRRVASGGAATILGDLAQSTSPWAPDDWKEHLAAGGIEADEIAELTASYRIPVPLLDYANQLLQVIDVRTAPSRSVIEEGEDPSVIEADSRGDGHRLAADVVDSIIYTGAKDGQIGVIGDDDDLAGVSRALEDREIEHTWAARSLTTPVTLVPYEEAKGLEFNYVVVMEPGKLYRSDPVLGPRRLFVAATRARDDLTFIHSTPLPPVLEGGGPGSSAPTSVDTESAQGPPGSLGPTDRPAAAADGRQPIAARARQVSGWRWVVRADERLYEVVVEGDGGAQVLELPQEGGAPVVLATGTAVAGKTALAWALLVASGEALALSSPSDPQDAAAKVVFEIMAADGG